MSVEPSIIRVTQAEFDSLREHPEKLGEFIETGYESGAFSHSDDPAKPLSRMLRLNEFQMWLLAGFDEDTPLCRALIGWDGRSLEGATRGHGAVRYRAPDEVMAIAAELDAFPQERLHERFRERAEEFRLSAAGYFDNDEAIIEHQLACFLRLRDFYRAAAAEVDSILLTLV